MIRNGVKKTQPIKKPLVTQSKPTLYIRVEKEKLKMKNIKKLTYQTEFSLKKKYFGKLKFYHTFIQMRKRNILKYKFMAFSVLRDYFFEKIEKYCDIIQYFDRGRKIKAFTLLYKEHILNTKKNYIIRKFIINGYQRFIQNTTRDIYLRYLEYRNIGKFYFQLFFKQALNYSRNELRLSIQKSKYLQMNMRKGYQEFFDIILLKKTLKLKEFAVNKYNAYKSFYTQSKKIINFNLDLNISIRRNQMKSGFKYFISDCKKLLVKKKKSLFARMFYVENTKRKIFNKYKNMYLIKNNFCNIVYGILRLYKQKIVYKIKREIDHISNLRKLYKQMKNSKKKPIFKQYLTRLRKKIKYKKIMIYARNHYYKKLFRKGFKGLENNIIKEKAFKIFLSKFKKIYIQNLKKNYIDLMRYRVHKFLESPSLPPIIYYYLNKDFEKKLIAFKYKEIRSFFRKFRKQKLNKIIIQKKLDISSSFHNKNQTLKCFQLMKDYVKFIKINKKFNKLIMKSLFKSLKKITEEKMLIEKIKNRLKSTIYKDYLKKILLSYILLNRKYCINKKRNTLKFLINENNNENLKKRIKDIPTLILINLIIQKIKKKPFKEIIKFFIRRKYSFFLIKKYINLLIEAKNGEKEVQEKYSMIKDEIFNLKNK